MRRREVLALLGTLPVTFPIVGQAQQTQRLPRIGYLTFATGSPENLEGVTQIRAVVDGLRDLGWIDGRNITIDHRFTGSGRERSSAVAKDLVAANPEVILSVGGLPTAAALAATQTIPIVFASVTDPVGAGFVTSLAHPGGNVTGIAVSEAPIAGKWLQLLKEVAPQVMRALVLMQADSPPQLLLRDNVAAAAPSLQVTVATAAVLELADYQREIDGFAHEPGGGLIVLPNTIVGSHREAVQALAMQHRLPAIYSNPVFAKIGGLVAYGADPGPMLRQAVGYVDKILRGAKPGDLPVEQPTRFVLAVNLRTVKALGLTVPQSILARADEIIE
ncbi:MAG TPA: ABC transporter substrate-binding protein [Stellaceae bacterium]|jgi:putative ABC transport system substrate-binding protein|nr:ABC transporter substrate-binding protein [Stellaceae bacterium]